MGDCNRKEFNLELARSLYSFEIIRGFGGRRVALEIKNQTENFIF